MVDKTDDKTLTAEGEDDFVMIEVDEIPTPAAAPAAGQGAADEHGDEGGDEGGEGVIDSRLADDDEDEDEDSPGKKERQKRRQRQKAARDAAQSRLRILEAQNTQLAQRLEALEGGQTNTQKAMTASAIEAARAEVTRAERIMAAAVEAGNGADVVEATQLRDEARDSVRALEAFNKTLDAPRPVAAPVNNPAAESFKSTWMAQNPWFNVQGGDEDSEVTLVIDRNVKAAGFDPSTIEYWQELTRRVARRLGGSASSARETARDPVDPAAPSSTKRKGPPMGDSRNHAPPSTRREVYVTPERKKAMQEAGYWDDPAKRAQMLRSYAAHDRDHPVR